MRKRTPAIQPPGITGAVLRVGPCGHGGPGSSGRSAGQSGGGLVGTGAQQFPESANYGTQRPTPAHLRGARSARARRGHPLNAEPPGDAGRCAHEARDIAA